nr:MAG: ORF1 [Torque teno midi virus]
MPGWWPRRRRWWWGRKTNYTRRRRKPKRRQKRRRYRRRPYRFSRRKRWRKRKHKVRRKRKTIPILQWQPDSIRNCHIKGYDTFILGAEGKQSVCYTNTWDAWTIPRTPGGGGFAVQQYSLGWLYEQYKFRKNIWTASNMLKDLARFMRVTFTFYSHPETDFIVCYERQPPYELTKFTYPLTHPTNLLLQKHKKIIKSKKTKPNAKYKYKFTVRPPKQMISKWFFTKHLSEFPLTLLRGAACNLNYTRMAPTAENTLMEFYYLNMGYYTKCNWGLPEQGTFSYKPHNNVANNVTVKYIDGKTKDLTLNSSHGVAYEDGYFCSSLMRAVAIKTTGTSTFTGTTPVNVARYNMNKDTGKNNSICLVSILTESYKKPSDEVLYFDGLPLWMLLFGYLQYVDVTKKGKGFLDSYIMLVKSPAIEPAPQPGTTEWYPIIDKDFIDGKGPFGSYVTLSTKSKWYPNVSSQLKTINTFVECGPLIPKYSEERNSNWELHYMYDFSFKWGGPLLSDPTVANPETLPTYDVPDTISKAIQIRNPQKQKASSMLHSWDIRRGLITASALKRMSADIETDTTFQADTDIIPKKKKKTTGPALQNQDSEEEEVHSSLLSLFEEPTYQETPQTMQQLIEQQQQQQQQLKYNILRLISQLKEKQQQLQLHTGALL